MKINMTTTAPAKGDKNAESNNELESAILTLTKPTSKPYVVITAITRAEAERIGASIQYYRRKHDLKDVINYRTITNSRGKRNIVLWNKTRTKHPYH